MPFPLLLPSFARSLSIFRIFSSFPDLLSFPTLLSFSPLLLYCCHLLCSYFPAFLAPHAVPTATFFLRASRTGTGRYDSLMLCTLSVTSLKEDYDLSDHGAVTAYFALECASGCSKVRSPAESPRGEVKRFRRSRRPEFVMEARELAAGGQKFVPRTRERVSSCNILERAR
eukprot:755206-Hanusia_phi.AAC.2